MTLPLAWRDSAREDLFRLLRQIALFDPAAVEALRERIEMVVLPLSEHRYPIGRAGFPAPAS